jgi:cell division protein FtsQ
MARKKNKPPANRRTQPRRPNRRQAPARPRIRLRARFRLARRRLNVVFARVRAVVAFAVRVVAILAVVAGAVAAGRLLERHVRTSDAFATTTIRVEGLTRLDRREVIDAAGLRLGRNIFDVDAEEAERRLLDHAWIASATVQRRLPGSYGITIREHRAVALLSMGELYLVASDATLFKRLGEGDPVDLPVITGVDREEFTTDREFRTAVLRNAVTLLDDYSQAGLRRREPIAEIHVERDLSTSAYIGADATYVRLGKPPYLPTLRRLRRVLDRIAKKKSRAAYVYLDNVHRPDRVTVRLR